MIHIQTFRREAADNLANQLVRKCGIKVYVYRSPDLDGFYVLDEAGFALQIKVSKVLRTVHNPERRAHPRVPFRARGCGHYVRRVAHA